MAQNQRIFDYYEESQSDKLARKSKESPFMIIGIGSFLAAVGYGAYTFKNRGKMSTSVFLMQFRVISQGAVVGALSLGMIYHMYTNYVVKPSQLPKPIAPSS